MIDLRTFILVDGMEDQINFTDVRWYSRQLEPDVAAANSLAVSTVVSMLRTGEVVEVGNSYDSADPWQGTPEELGDRLAALLALPNDRSDSKWVGDQDLQVMATWLDLSPDAIERGKAFWREHQQEWDDLFPDL